MPPDTFRSLSTAVSAETPRVRGSRFLADARPVADAAQAAAALDGVRRREHAATHHVWAYRLGPDGAETRCSDDGEPSGTGGIPVLRAIEAAGLTDTLVVVTRYYGGTKLGTGGLARAYGEAAAAALDAAPVAEHVVRTPVALRFAFADTAAAMRLLDRYDALRREEAYDPAGATLVLDVRASQADALRADFVEATAGRGEVLRPR